MIEHFYQRLHGCFTFAEFYQSIAVEILPVVGWHGVEVGALYGQSAACLAVHLLRVRAHVEQHGERKCPRLDLVERSDHRAILSENLASVSEVIGTIHSPVSSVDASRMYEDGSLDFVMLDADHTLQSVRDDIAHWWPKVQKGGVLAGHDFSHYFPGVMRAALEAFPRLSVWRGSLWPDDTVAEPRRSEAERDIQARSAHGGKDDFHAVWWVRK
jgi:hypothetical protein